MKRSASAKLQYMTFIPIGIGHRMAPLQILYYMTLTLKLNVESSKHICIIQMEVSMIIITIYLQIVMQP